MCFVMIGTTKLTTCCRCELGMMIMYAGNRSVPQVMALIFWRGKLRGDAADEFGDFLVVE